jgi:hypothetical protein
MIFFKTTAELSSASFCPLMQTKTKKYDDDDGDFYSVTLAFRQ